MSNLIIDNKKVKSIRIVGKEVAKLTLNGKTFTFNQYPKTELSMSEFSINNIIKGNFRFTNSFVAMEDDTYADNEHKAYERNGYSYYTSISKAFSDHKELSARIITIKNGRKFIEEEGGHFLLTTVGLGFIPVHVTSRQTGEWIFEDTIVKNNISFDQTNFKIHTGRGEVYKDFSKAEKGLITWNVYKDDLVINLKVFVNDSGGEQGLAGYFNADPSSKMIIEGVK